MSTRYLKGGMDQEKNALKRIWNWALSLLFETTTRTRRRKNCDLNSHLFPIFFILGVKIGFLVFIVAALLPFFLGGIITNTVKVKSESKSKIMQKAIHTLH